MSMAVSLVLVSGIMHAVWNMYTKSSRNKNMFLLLTHFFGFFIFLPFFIHDIQEGIPLAGYGLMMLSCLFQMGYAFFLPRAYQRADMSQAYPVMRGLAALFVPVLGVALFGEHLSFIGWLGVSAVVVGLFAIGGIWNMPKGRIVTYWPLLGVGLSITGYTLTDKMLLNYISPLSLLELANIGFIIMLGRNVSVLKDAKSEWKENWRKIILGTVLTPGSYLLFLFAMKLGPVSQLAPIREISTVVGSILGVWLLKEAEGLRRVAYSALITAGIIAIGVWGA
ncbi:EamA family transporter [Bacillaceae bacterium SIJ1]|uniref:SMR family transporter n=1 Tax=Litoribacterium kuwaitense TaxID=1398745 RepID=UPI0013EAD6AC|nr:SMR family transporter [Litoribacterium kuwaitense]NGP45174.1 EamA family transporter [Litoribacterium kuwaitense]